jgi:putative sterol carrier protein
MSMDAIAEKMRAKVTGSGFDRSVKFDCGSNGVIVIDGESVSTADAPADCTITLSQDDLENMLAGELSPTAAFMQGKLKVSGDMSIAMALSQVI